MRHLTFALQGAAAGGGPAAGAVALAGHLAVLALLVALGLLARRAWPGAALIAIAWPAQAAAYSFEALFGRLPGVRAMYFLGEVEMLLPSLARELSPAAVAGIAALIAAGIGGYVGALACLREGRPPPASRGPVYLTLVAAAVALTAHASPGLVPAAAFWGSRQPLIYLAQTAFTGGAPAAEGDMGARAAAVRAALGGPAARAPDPDYPLCLEGAPSPPPARGPDVILLIVESVGRQELDWDYQGIPVTPAMRRMAAEGVDFARAYAPGTRTSQAVVPLFSGLGAQTGGKLLQRMPLRSLDGWPRLLAERGYASSYFHGAGMGFEQKREYLERAGVGAIFEVDLSPGAPVYGWGNPDGHVFDRFMAWIGERRAAGQPYAATLFTLSTHHPFTLPPDHQRRWPGGEVIADYADTLRYTDDQVGRFYEWYLAEGLGRDTALIVVGDHVAHVVNAGLTSRGEPLRFDAPMIFLGDPVADRVGGRRVGDRLASLMDVPATILGLAGAPPLPCGLGRDLLAEAWAPGRRVYALDGEQLEEIHVMGPEGAVVIDRARGSERLIPAAPDASPGAAIAAARSLLSDLEPLSAWLAEGDAFAPARAAAARDPLPPVAAPALWRRLPPGDAEASCDALEASPGVLYLPLELPYQEPAQIVQSRSDPARRMPLAALLECLDASRPLALEIVPGRYADVMMRGVYALAPAVAGREVILVAPHPDLASRARAACGCPVGMRAPGALSEAALTIAEQVGLSWVLLPAAAVDARRVETLRGRGLRVAVEGTLGHDAAGVDALLR